MTTPSVHNHDQDLEHLLRTHYHEEFGQPSSSSLFWTRLSEQLPTQQSRAWWQFNLPGRFQALSLPQQPAQRRKTRHAAVALSLALGVLLLLSVFFFASGSMTRTPKSQPGQVASHSPDTDALLSAFLQKDPRVSTLAFTTVQQTGKSLSGTVKLGEIHADANNVIIAYTIEGDSHTIAQAFSASPEIVLPDQQLLKPFIMESDPTGGKVAIVAYFEASSLPNSADHITLHIVIPIGSTNEDFHPTVPFSAGKVVQVGQSSTAQGRTLTLDRLVLTPSEVRIYYTVSEPFQEAPTWRIIAGGRTFDAAIFGFGPPISFWSTGLLNQTGTWTIKVQNTWQFSVHIQ